MKLKVREIGQIKFSVIGSTEAKQLVDQVPKTGANK